MLVTAGDTNTKGGNQSEDLIGRATCPPKETASSATSRISHLAVRSKGTLSLQESKRADCIGKIDIRILNQEIMYNGTESIWNNKEKEVISV